MKSSPSAPTPPNPAVVTAAQSAANVEAAREQARLNRLQEFTPFGTVTFGTTGDPNFPFRRTTTLHPSEHAQLERERALNLSLTDLGQSAVNRIGGNIAQPLSLGGLPGGGDPNLVYLDRVRDALYSRLEPDFQRDEERLRTQLANQGIGVGSEAYADAMQQFSRARNDARMQAQLASGAEASRLFGLQQAARERALQERIAQRATPLNELATILGTAGPINVPQFGGVPQVGVGPADVQGAIANQYAGQVANFNAQQALRQANLGGLYGLGGAAIGGFFS